jgi:tetrathionate reductase subunit B
MDTQQKKGTFKRRDFIRSTVVAIAGILSPGVLSAKESMKKLQSWIIGEKYDPFDHDWGMAIDVNKCIGCGSCARACKTENAVPDEPFYFRTWVERYHIFTDGSVEVDSPNGATRGFDEKTDFKQNVMRSFFVPKLCNQCDNPPCVQVCPVGATFKTPDGVILVDSKHCIGCGYCIQACPYGARYINPETHTVDKCTFCYHRLVRDMVPACVEACPTQARIFGELHKKSSPLLRFKRMNKIGVLKPALNTEPKVIYANLDMEVN